MCQPQIGFRQHESDLTLILNWRNSRHSLSLFCSSFCFFSLFFCAQNMWCLMRCRYALLQFHRKRRAYRGKSAYRGVSVCCSQQTNVICMHVSVSAHFRCRAKCARDARGKASVCSFCSVCFAEHTEVFRYAVRSYLLSKQTLFSMKCVILCRLCDFFVE